MRLLPVPLLVLAGACAGLAGCGGGEPAAPEAPARRVETVRSLYERLEEGPRTALPEVRATFWALASADRVAAAPLGEPLRFRDLSLPGDARVSAGVGLYKPDGRPLGQLAVQLELELEGGAVARSEHALSLRAGPGRSWVELDLPLRAQSRVAALTLTFEAPAARADEPAWIALLRPDARFEHELPPPPAGAAPPRQVVFVTLDTLRADHLGCYGAEAPRTPALDALAAESVRFANAFTVCNSTNPSHASMLTSLYVKDHGLDDNHQRLSPDLPSLPRELAARGFATGAIVGAANFDPAVAGFAEHFESLAGPREAPERRAEEVNADAFAWLDAHVDRDFFLWLHYFDPHLPYNPPPPFDRAYTVDDPRAPEPAVYYEGSEQWLTGARDVGELRARYMGEVAYLDEQLGRLFAHLKRLGIWERALLVVTSDHGESLGEHGIHFDHVGLYEETLRVPLLVKPPRRAAGATPPAWAPLSGELATGAPPRGALAHGLVSTVDLWPTVFGLLGLALEHPIRGRSLVPDLLAAYAGEEAGAGRVWAEHARVDQAAVRTASHKLLLDLVDRRYFPGYAMEAGSVELYDLAADPRELADLSAAEAERAAALRAELEAFLEDARGLEAPAIEDPGHAERLRALGYVK